MTFTMTPLLRRLTFSGIAAVFAVTIFAAARPASAAAFDGVLGVKGPGSVYAGTNASGSSAQSAVTEVSTPGGTASFAAEVINKGTDTAQFELDLANGDGDQSTPQLLSGSLDVTALARGAHGLVTNPLQPGKSQLFTLKVGVPASAYYQDNFFESLTLYSVGRGIRLSTSTIAVSMKATSKDGNGNFLLTSAYQPSVLGDTGYYETPTFMTAPTIKTNTTATFTATIHGGGVDANSTGIQDTLSLTRETTCSRSSWIVAAKVGMSDITSELFAGTYTTPVIKPTASLTITITVKAVSPVPDTLSCPDSLELLLSGTETNDPYAFRSDLITNTVS